MSTAIAGPVLVQRYDGDPRDWDAFVQATNGASYCHRAGWRDVIEGVLGHETLYHVATDEQGRWLGVLPLGRVRSRLTGDYLISMPFLNAGGPVGDSSARNALAQRAVALARDLGVSLLELRGREPLGIDLTISNRKVTVLLPLPSDPEELWASFPSKLRSQVRRPLKDGLTARFGAEHLEAFYDVFCRNMRALGTPVLPLAFFERIASVFSDLVLIGAVYVGDRPVAGGLGFFWQGTFEITWASSLREYSRSAPNMLLYWSLMKEAISRGATCFDFGRSTPESGPHRFKLQWGGENLPLPWAQWSPRRVQSTPSPERPIYRAASAVWRRLPLRVTKAVGPTLARLLP